MTALKTVLFLSPFSPGVPVQSGDLSFPPVGYLSIAGYCRRIYPDVQYIFRDFMAERIPLDQQLRAIAEIAPQIIGLAGRSFAYPACERLAMAIRRAFPDIRIVLGGHHVTLMGDAAQYPDCFDTVVLREGEQAMSRLMQDYIDDKPWPARLKVPFMAEETLDWEYAWDIVSQPQHYAQAISPFQPDSMGSTVWSRGCPFTCVFCSAPALWEGSHPAVRYRTPASICDELEYMVKVLGMKRIFIHDDVLNMHTGKLIDICEEIIRRRIKITWGATGMRADEKLTPEYLFPVLRRAGCRMISFGIESGDPDILVKIGRKVTHAEIERALALTRKYGILTGGSFTLGHIWETSDGSMDGEREESLEKTLAYLKRLISKNLLWSVIIAVIDPVPGSRLWDIAKRNKILRTENLEKLLAYDRVRLNFDHPHLSAEVIEDYYLRCYRTVATDIRHAVHMFLSARSLSEVAGLLRAATWVLRSRMFSGLRSGFLAKSASRGVAEAEGAQAPSDV